MASRTAVAGVGWGRLVHEFAQAHPWLVVFNVAYLVAMPLSEIAMPHLYGRLVTVMQRRGTSSTRRSWVREVHRIFALIVIVLVVTRIIFYFSELLDAKFTTTLHAFIRDQSLSRLLQVVETQPEGTMRIGEVVSKFIKLPWAMEHVINAWRGIVIPRIVVFLCAAAYMWIAHDAWMGALLLMLGLVYVALVIYVPLRCCDQSIARDRLYNLIINDVDDVLRNSVSVFSQGQEEAEKARVSRRGLAYATAYQRMVRCWLPSYGVVSIITVTFLSVFMWRTFRLASKGNLSAAALVPITVIMMYFINAFAAVPTIIRPLTMNYGTTLESATVLEPTQKVPGVYENEHDRVRDTEVQALVAREEELAMLSSETYPAQAVGCIAPVLFGNEQGVRIEFIGVTYRYPGASQDTLHDFDAVFESGLTTVVWGPIGCGKSTLLKLLLKYVSPSAGRVTLNGVCLSGIPVKTLRRAVGYVPQQASLFDRSILENVLYGNTPCMDEDDAERVVAALGLATGSQGFGGKGVKGMRSPAGKGGSELSGGQRQAVLVARALLKEPSFLIMDEPTSSMDVTSKEQMRRMLISPGPHGLRGKTVIIVTHDEFLLENVADRVIRVQAYRPTP